LNGLLFYPVQYEGNESSRNIVYTGAAPNQQILPAIEWLLSEAGGSRKRIYLVGSDYVFPRTANFIITKLLQARGLNVAGENYTPLGHRDFKETIQLIRNADPDAILSTINGDSNVGFYNELAQQGITADRIPVVATSVGEDELRSLLPSRVKGHVSAWNYFQSLTGEANAKFIAAYKAKFGKDAAITDPMGTTSFTFQRISSITPAVVLGTSLSTLSVAISKTASSTSILSPTFLSQLVMVASATLSPILGNFNSNFAISIT
jgi:urea transport system substrate-binding protein